MGSVHRPLHPKHGSWLNQAEIELSMLLDVMFGHAENSGSGEVEAGNRGLEQHGQPGTKENQLEVHPPEGQKDVRLREARQAARDRLTGRTEIQTSRVAGYQPGGSTSSDSQEGREIPLKDKIAEEIGRIESGTTGNSQLNLRRCEYLEPFQAV